jgi:predicted O-methyltransferase YrrM
MNMPSSERLPADFTEAADDAWRLICAAPGFLTEREGRFLILASACAPAEGTILEIGSFKGKSTVGLAASARHYDLGTVVAVDPHTSPSETDPALENQSTTWDDFLTTLHSAGLDSQVEPHRAFSRDLARGWDRPIRLLWIDGDHTYEGVKLDFDLFSPFLVEGAVIAFHDTLHEFDGPLRVFVEHVLLSDRFGPAGFSGSIGWAQYRPNDGGQQRFKRARFDLARRCRPLVNLLKAGRHVGGMRKLWFKLLRSRVPHDLPDALEWVKRTAIAPPGAKT